MARTRRKCTSIPLFGFAPQYKRNRTPILNISMTNPALIPSLPIDNHALHIVALIAEPLGRNMQRLVTIIPYAQSKVREPGTEQQVDGLCHDGIEAQEIPDQPRIKGAGVAVSREARGRGTVVLVYKLAGTEDGFVLTPGEVVVEERGLEGRFVAWKGSLLSLGARFRFKRFRNLPGLNRVVPMPLPPPVPVPVVLSPGMNMVSKRVSVVCGPPIKDVKVSMS